MSIGESPFFSIVIPTYNSEKYLVQSLESVLEQNFLNWEVLIIDNFSNDSTDQILKNYSDSRIRISKINNYGSISTSRNLGIRQARGEWIAFLDSDDWWTSNKLIECKAKIEDNIDFIYHDLAVISDNKKHKDLECRQLSSPVMLDLLMNGNPIAASSVVVRKSILEKIGYMNELPSLIKTADYNAWLKIAKITNSFFHIPKKLGYYRIHGANTSNDLILQPTLDAMAEFLYLLDDRQQSRVKNNLTFAQARVKFINKKYPDASIELIHTMKHGSYSQKIKSLVMLTSANIKIFTYKFLRST